MSCATCLRSTLPTRSSFLGSAVSCRKTITVQAPRTLVIENAHKKGAGSTKNGRQSNAQRRGVKVYGGNKVTDGGIIVRQTGNTFHAGNNVLTGKDFTLYSIMEGTVVFEVIKQRKCVSVYPEGHPKTEGLKLKRQPDSRASKRLEQWANTPRVRAEK